MDLPLIEKFIISKNAALVGVDPLMAFPGPEIDTHGDSSSRRITLPSRNSPSADRRESAPSAISRNRAAWQVPCTGGGSIGIIGAARSALLFARDPDNPEQCILAQTKNNLGEEPEILVKSGKNSV